MILGWVGVLPDLWYLKLPLFLIPYGIVGYDAKKGKTFSYFHERIDAPIHGTGDVFTSVMVGHILSGKTLETASRLAADYVRETVRVTYPYLAEHPYGLLFEKTLGRLVPKDGE